MNLQLTKSQALLWSVPECAYRVTIPAAVLDEIRFAAVDASRSAPRGGVEIGGVFFGARQGDFVCIQTQRRTSCQYLTGPSFKLSADDKAALCGVLRLPESDPDLAGLEVLGWYHSHTRSEIFLSSDDLDVHQEFFPHDWQIAMVLKPVNLQLTRAGLFFRDYSGVMKSDAASQEFNLEPPFSGLMPLSPEEEAEITEMAASSCAAAPEPAPDVACEKPTLKSPLAKLAALIAAEYNVDNLMAGSGAPPTEARDSQPETPVTTQPYGFARQKVRGDDQPPSFEIPKPEAALDHPARALNQSGNARPDDKSSQKAGWLDRLNRMLEPIMNPERRSSNRESGVGLLAFYWDGGKPEGHRIRNISSQGAFVEGTFLWPSGTVMNLTLLDRSSTPQNSIVVPVDVVRTCADGIGVRFRARDMDDPRPFQEFLSRWSAKSLGTVIGNPKK